jgi:hypothetical protein
LPQHRFQKLNERGSERACERDPTLPPFPSMTAEQINYVATSVLDVVGKK